MPDDDDRPSDASSAADPAWSVAVAPDDISSLAADIAAYHREQRAARRRERLHRLFARPGISALAMTAAGLAIAAIVATLLTLTEPPAISKGPSPLPLAASPVASPGQVHGLMPDVTLKSAAGKTVGVQTMRPAVFALIPPHCSCVQLLNDLSSAAAEQSMGLNVVAPTTPDADASALLGQLDRGRPEVYFDTAGRLAAGLAAPTGAPAAGVTLILVDRDGTIASIQPGVTAEASTNLSAALGQMLAPKAQVGG
jgi:hypothetical protein